MKLVCFGAGAKSEKVQQLIQNKSNDQVLYYVENQVFEKIGTCLNGIEIISIYSMADKYKSKEIDGVVITTEYHKHTVEEMIQACVQMGIRNEDIYVVPFDTLTRSNEEISAEDLMIPYKESIQLYELNIHIVDHCNMNCELCCHNSQLVDGEVFADIDTYRRDLDRLHELIPQIRHISLLGGEPLLNPDISKYIEYARKIYPFAGISIVTNGILLRQMSQGLMDCLRKNNVDVSISLYPPMHKELDSLLCFIRENHMNAKINRVTGFFKKFCEKPVLDPKEMSSYCGYCMGMRDGKISRCIDSLYTDYFNKHFGKILPENAGIDLYDKNLTGLELMHRLEQPMELCAYCATKYTLVDLFDWKQVTGQTSKEDILYHI